MFVFYLHDETSVTEFENKLRWFISKYHLISYQELQECVYKKNVIRNACHLTIDDGWKSTYNVIFPVLKKYNVPFTIFVSPKVTKDHVNFWYKNLSELDEYSFLRFLINEKGFSSKLATFPAELIMKEMKAKDIYELLGEYRSIYKIKESTDGFLNTDELIEISESGLAEIGAHTMTHPILKNEDESTVYHELSQSIKELEEIIGRKVSTFAYPNGLRNLDFTQREEKIVSSLGLKTAFSVNPGYINSQSNPFALPRIGSIKRLSLGRLGVYLPSMSRQESIRKEIRQLIK